LIFDLEEDEDFLKEMRETQTWLRIIGGGKLGNLQSPAAV
jgi:hypothetical protein